MPLAFWEERRGLQQEGAEVRMKSLYGDAGARVVLIGSRHKLVAQAFGLSFHVCGMGLP